MSSCDERAARCGVRHTRSVPRGQTPGRPKPTRAGCEHTHAHTHARTHAHARTHTHVSTHARTHTAHTHTHTHTHTRPRAHTRTCTHTNTHARMHSRRRTRTRTRDRAGQAGFRIAERCAAYTQSRSVPPANRSRRGVRARVQAAGRVRYSRSTSRSVPPRCSCTCERASTASAPQRVQRRRAWLGLARAWPRLRASSSTHPWPGKRMLNFRLYLSTHYSAVLSTRRYTREGSDQG